MKNAAAQSVIPNDCYSLGVFFQIHSPLGPFNQLYNNTSLIPLDEDSFTSFPFIFSISPLDIVIWVTLGSDLPHKIRKESIERHPRLWCIVTSLLS